jgi:hypothetical protein
MFTLWASAVRTEMSSFAAISLAEHPSATYFKTRIEFPEERILLEQKNRGEGNIPD